MKQTEMISNRIKTMLAINPLIKPRHIMADTLLSSITAGMEEGTKYRLIRKLWLELIGKKENRVKIQNSSTFITNTGYASSSSYSFSITPPTSIVGVLGDTHEPYCHIDYKPFVKHTFESYGVDRVVHIGDEVDNYALSYHEKNPDAPSAVSEAEKAQAAMQGWYNLFPNVDVIVGNHSALPHRKATTAGIPKKFLKTYEEIWKAPIGWKWHMDLEIDGVKYIHGLFCSGVDGAIKRAITNRQSTVIGHAHSFGGVIYHSSTKDMIFGLNVGCGVDQKAYAFDFSKDQATKWTLGCGIVKHGKEAIFVPMITNEQGRWIGPNV
jgi:predicted phosphodiesterase